ncbi:alpha/beta fold hydrolase [Ramlibacter alkalitolerans]|uniref:Alpha/beta hydrolase n=1 Tax=Ramlibacter alkalitolerans TaxID=2039631 RepID=A0ABS1JWJ0_9BURK|nr:alpha/beta fold hydrolase [Ramlibacter alkalitolerans]MBL0428577.1 alpha/beta hydrolase [Ramlibacter alkalitolerans]
MANFVLVHGAWHGAWAWRRVVDALHAQGHRALAVCLTGVGERVHLMSSLITLETHIADVTNTLEAEELQDVVLAVHSYAGMIGTAVADRMPQRLKHLVYIDAVVPKPGESWSSTHASATREARLAAAQGSPDFAFPAPDPSVFGLAAADHAWVQRRQTPHPGHTYQAPLQFDARRVASVPRTFIDCVQPRLGTIDSIRPRVRDAGFWDGEWMRGGGAQVRELATGHDPMISAPQELVRMLVECAG